MSGKNILIIEDDSIIALDIEQFLRNSGYIVHTARNGVEALEKIKQNVYDLVFADNRMPLMSGEQLYTEIQNIDQALAKKVVFVSASLTDFIESTNCTFTGKPLYYEDLLEAIKKLAP